MKLKEFSIEIVDNYCFHYVHAEAWGGEKSKDENEYKHCGRCEKRKETLNIDWSMI